MQTEVAETALVRIEQLTAVQLFQPGAIDPILEQIESEARAEAAKLDISSEIGRKALASLAYKIARSKTFIDTQRKNLVSDEKKRLQAIDKEGGRIWDKLEFLQADIRKPLTEWENAEKDRVAAHEAALREIEAAGPYSLQNWQSLSAEAIGDRLKEIESESRQWEEFGARAAGVKAVAVKQITDALAKREKYDAEQAELERLRKEAAERAQQEREERIAREAREKAEREAHEREEQERRRAEAEQQRIEREKDAAEDRARAAEQARVDAEATAERHAKEAAERAEREKQQAIEAERARVERERIAAEEEQKRREANKKHRARIEAEALDGLLAAGVPEEFTGSLLLAIREGKVPHIQLNY